MEIKRGLFQPYRLNGELKTEEEIEKEINLLCISIGVVFVSIFGYVIFIAISFKG